MRSADGVVLMIVSKTDADELEISAWRPETYPRASLPPSRDKKQLCIAGECSPAAIRAETRWTEAQTKFFRCVALWRILLVHQNAVKVVPRLMDKA